MKIRILYIMGHHVISNNTFYRMYTYHAEAAKAPERPFTWKNSSTLI